MTKQKNNYTHNLDYTNELNRSNIYDQARIIDFDKHVKKQERFCYSKLHWKQIPRANNPNKPLQAKAVILLSTIVFKLRKKEVAVLNHNYLSRITDCEKDQNLNLLKQLSGVLDISFNAKTTINGKVCRNSYTIKHTAKGRTIIENPEVLLAQKHFVGKVAVTPIEQEAAKDKKDDTCTEFFRPSSIYKEKVLENNRSNESTFLDNSNSSIIQSKQSNFVEAKNTVLPEEGDQEEIIHILNPNKPRKSVKEVNQRKKPTKVKKAKLLHFNQYNNPKNLADHYPLTTEDCSALQSKSGRDFNLNSMNEILLSLSKKPKQQKHQFPSKASFMAYMAKVLLHEKRQAVQINKISFKIKANLTKEEIVQHTTLAQREAYLAEEENRAIRHRSDESQFRAKLVGTLAPNQAYNILSNLVCIEKKGEVFKLHLRNMPKFTELAKVLILDQANAVGAYSGVERLEFVLNKDKISIDAWCRADNTELNTIANY